jgi:hypothetical protein
LITSNLDSCMAVSCNSGFLLNGAVSGAFSSVSTSVTLRNCYANGSTVNGYKVTDSTYVSFLGCASDFAANSTGSAYLLDQCSCVSFFNCGTELNGTVTLSDMWRVQNGSAQVSLYDCYAFQPKTGNCVYVTGSSVGITVIGFQVNSNVSGTTGLKVDAGSSTTEINCNFSGANTPRTIAGSNLNLDTLGVVNLTAGVAAAGGAPLKFQAGTLLTTAEDGAIEMDANALYATTDAGNRGVIPVEHIIRADATRTFTSNTTQQAIFTTPANGTLTLETGTYFFEGLIAMTAMSATSGNGKFSLIGAGSATLGAVLWQAYGNDLVGSTETTGAATGGSWHIIATQTAANVSWLKELLK